MSHLFCRAQSHRRAKNRRERRNQKNAELIGNMGANSNLLISWELNFHKRRNPNKIKDIAKYFLEWKIQEPLENDQRRRANSELRSKFLILETMPQSSDSGDLTRTSIANPLRIKTIAKNNFRFRRRNSEVTLSIPCLLLHQLARRCRYDAQLDINGPHMSTNVLQSRSKPRSSQDAAASRKHHRTGCADPVSE